MLSKSGRILAQIFGAVMAGSKCASQYQETRSVPGFFLHGNPGIKRNWACH
jgi:hypothetical protein